MSRAEIKERYGAYPDHLLRWVVEYNRTLNATALRSGMHVSAPIVQERYMVAEVAAEILKERGNDD